jgi:hypothetical protein
MTRCNVVLCRTLSIFQQPFEFIVDHLSAKPGSVCDNAVTGRVDDVKSFIWRDCPSVDILVNCVTVCDTNSICGIRMNLEHNRILPCATAKKEETAELYVQLSLPCSGCFHTNPIEILR